MSTKNGMNFALAFTNFDEETEPILDESYGKIKYISREWGQNGSSSRFVNITEI